MQIVSARISSALPSTATTLPSEPSRQRALQTAGFVDDDTSGHAVAEASIGSVRAVRETSR
jgi:hypothetical protein